MVPGDSVAVHVHSSVGEINAEDWDACVEGGGPFLSHAFLLALEESGSAVPKRGWLPQHLTVLDGDERPIGVAPLYLKMHSYGEYVFDFSWANAYTGGARSYYPKLQCCVPFTPVTGPRLLVRAGEDEEKVRGVLCSAMMAVAKQHEVSSLHITFPTEAEWKLAKRVGMRLRRGIQYHWHNRGYDCFEAFLGALTTRKRKAIKRERRGARDCGVELRVLSGDALQTEHWDAFYRFYRNTIDRKWARPYLTREFFAMIGEVMPEKVVLMLGFDGDEPVAGALNFTDEEAIYGRYWGAAREHRFLHFEACYYRAIELAIERGLKRVEAGAQGEHKIQRGYLPAYTYSAHWLADPDFDAAIIDFLKREAAAVEAEYDYLLEHSPYKG